MNIEPLGLFHWQNTYAKQAKYVLAFSNIPGITWKDYEVLTGWTVPKSFDLNKNEDRGALELRKVVSSHYSCKDEHVVTTTGGSEANFLVNFTLLKAKDEVIVETPVYEPLYHLPQIFGAKTVCWERYFHEGYRLHGSRDNISAHH